MSEHKFTKGEWSAFKDGKWSDCGNWSVDNYSASTHANVAVNVGDITICLVVSEGWDDTELEANAHLIAAAPEMYALLEKLVNPDNCRKDIIHIIGNAESLLARARGEHNA
jgi:hypothetical protein